jgi:tripartite-type tricarboxylate transporter receptor subunit TctC
MKPMFCRLLALSAMLGALGALAAHAADTYPSRPIRVIVPFPPGGPTDVVARIFALKLSEAWRQQAIVDNRVGAGGNIGMGIAANATGDGYTVLFVSSSMMANPSLYKSIPYDPYKSFKPVSVLVESTHAFFAHPATPVKTLRDMVDLVRKDPKLGNVATPPIGTLPYLSVHLLALDAKVKLVTIPYTGGGPSIAAVLGNQVGFGCQAIPPVTEHIRAGRVRALAFTRAKRLPLMPDVPTMAELGYKGHEASTISALLVPAGTPDEIVKRLHGEVVRILSLPDVKQRMADLGAEIVANTPQQFAAFIKSEVARWGKVIKDAGIPAN